MDNMPPIRSGWRWQMAGGAACIASAILADPALARPQVDFSLDREFRGRVVPSFSHSAPPTKAPSASLLPVKPAPPGDAERRSLTLLRLRFSL